jgi:glycosyltransferase involved in cell wall biosynthesis
MAAAESDGVTVYAGSIPYADMPNAVGNALVSISPQIPLKHGRSAVSPLKLFESMAAGVPVVVTDLPGLADTVRTAQCGIVVPPNDPRALANAVASLVLHPAEACSMGAKGRDAAVSQHSWRVRAEETSHVLESLIPQM